MLLNFSTIKYNKDDFGSTQSTVNISLSIHNLYHSLLSSLCGVWCLRLLVCRGVLAFVVILRAISINFSYLHTSFIWVLRILRWSPIKDHRSGAGALHFHIATAQTRAVHGFIRARNLFASLHSCLCVCVRVRESVIDSNILLRLHFVRIGGAAK